MGDRGNVYVHEGEEPGVYLYAHWSGYDLPRLVKKALIKGSDRWDDVAYLTRIIFDVIIDGDTGNTGFGISAFEMGGAEYPLVDVDVHSKTVTVDDLSYDFSTYVVLDLDETIYVEVDEDDYYVEVSYPAGRY